MDTIHTDGGRGGDEIHAGPDAGVCYVDADDEVGSCEDVTIVSGPELHPARPA